jgi:nucleoside-diphosphate-sugar epimerase
MILITGAAGYVGGEMLRRVVLEQGAEKAIAVVRAPTKAICKDIRQITVDLSEAVDLTREMREVEVVVHCAARVHRGDESEPGYLSLYRSANVETTRRLALQAARAGVKRFVYVSTVKVHGEYSVPGRPFRAHDTPSPIGPYAISKYEAEVALQSISRTTGLEVVIVRPPLIYGVGAKANFKRLQRVVASRLPLPLLSLTEKRSLVYLPNLIDLLMVCVTHSSAAGKTFLVSDGSDVSVSELVTHIASAMGRRVRQFYVPVGSIVDFAGILGYEGIADRICRPLQVDITDTKNFLSWTPSYTLEEGIEISIKGKQR